MFFSWWWWHTCSVSCTLLSIVLTFKYTLLSLVLNILARSSWLCWRYTGDIYFLWSLMCIIHMFWKQHATPIRDHKHSQHMVVKLIPSVLERAHNKRKRFLHKSFLLLKNLLLKCEILPWDQLLLQKVQMICSFSNSILL